MNFLNNLRVISIPYWSRWLIFFQLIGALCVAIFMISNSLGDPDKTDWIQAGAYVLGIVFPIFLFALIIWSSETGPTALQKKTSEFLTQMIPPFLERTEEAEREFFKHRSRKIPHALNNNKCMVYCNAEETKCYCDYILKNKKFTMMIRLEVNVKKANFNLYVNKDKLSPIIRDDDAESLDGIPHRLFKHTISGAQTELVAPKNSRDDGLIPESYVFNSSLIERSIMGQNYYVLVGSRTLTDDFLWNPAEKLFFAQDLVFMLRAFLTEQPNLFINEECQG